MQCVTFEVADGLAVVADAVILLFQYATVGQFGAQVAQRVVMMAVGGAVSGLGRCWRGRLKTKKPRGCFEARTLPINLEIYAGYGLLHLNIYLFKSLAQRIIHPIDLDL